MTPTTGAYAIVDAAMAALVRRDWAQAHMLSSLLVQRWDDLMEAHHLLGVTTYYRTFAKDKEVPGDSLRLSSQSGTLHVEFGKGFQKAGAHDLAARAFRTAALLDYHLRPALRVGFAGIGGAFNGQVLRRAAFRSIAAHRLAEVIETGSYRGTTTEFIAQVVDCPVQTTEADPYLFESTRLHIAEARRLGAAWAQRVEAHGLPSKDFLVELFATAPSRPGLSFFYLDAHEFDDASSAWPVLEELDLIRRARRDVIIMIDDFVVPDDPSYLPKGCTLAMIAPALPHYDACFLPISGHHDTGMQRGCCVLSGSADATALLNAVPELRAFPPSQA